MSLKVDLKSKEPSRGPRFDAGWIFVFVAVVVAFFIFYGFDSKLQGMIDVRQRELQDLKNKIAAYSGIETKLSSIKAEINALQGQITHLWEMRYDPLRYSILLVRLSKILPSNIWLNSLSIDPAKTQITLAGTSLAMPGHPPLAAIAKFIMNLQDDADHYFSNIILQSTSSGGLTGETWTFNMTLNYSVPLNLANMNSSAPQVERKP